MRTHRRTGGPAVRTSGLLLALALVAGSALGAETRPSDPPARPAAPALRPSLPDGSELTIYIITMGVGEEVWERFGHNAIVVQDRTRGTSIAYNYGLFSFRQENFLLRFVQGRMLYWMGAQPADELLPQYRAAQRSVWRQELNLTPPQRAALRDFLEWNSRDENRFYRYDYYRDNCSTRVRDAIDRVLGGAISAQSQGPASGTYRFHTLRLNTNNKPLYLGLALIEGQRVDAPITRWDEMFLPLKLREYLEDVRVPDSAGAMVPLVAREDTLYLSRAYPVPDQPPAWLPGFLVVGLGLGGALAWAGRGGEGSLRRKLLLWGGTVWALLTGIAGTIMVGMWAFTDHTVAGANENVLQCTVFALALGAILPFAGRRSGWARRPAETLVVLVAGLSLLGLLLKLLPGFDQVNGQVLALLVPANLGLMLGVRAALRKEGTAPAS